jgi:hypothetical protein
MTQDRAGKLGEEALDEVEPGAVLGRDRPRSTQFWRRRSCATKLVPFGYALVGLVDVLEAILKYVNRSRHPRWGRG